MFFTRSVLSRGSMASACAQNASDFCTIEEAMYNTYSLFIGTKEFEAFENDMNQVLIVGFMSLSTILLLNVVIAIVNDSFGDVADRAEKLFWLNRIYFICEIEVVRNFLSEDNTIARFFHKNEGKNEYEKEDEQNYKSSRYLECINDGNVPQNVNKMRLFFDILISSLTSYEDPDERIKIENLFKQVNHGGLSWIVEVPLPLRRVSSILIFPVWIVLGFFSVGWLWPPQVREYLLCSNGSKSCMDMDMGNQADTHDLKVSTTSIIHDQQDDCLPILKEQVQNMKCEVRHMKNDINTLMTLITKYETVVEGMRNDVKMMKDVMVRMNMKLNLTH